MDHATLRESLAGPGQDTRQWVSYGIVQPNAGDSRSVRFDDGDGNPLPHGALVDVKLEPSGTIAPCRVSGGMEAGAGEGNWSPIGPGDEVLVVLPEGDERAGCVIIGKLSNAKDKFPRKVAGQDVTQNNIAFKRMVSPYILETGASYMIRSALTGASWSMGATGNLIFNDGAGSMLALSPDAIILQESTGTALLQIDPSKKNVVIQADTSSLLIDPNAASFTSPGTFAFNLAGMNASGHAITFEQTVGLILNAMVAMSLAGAFEGPASLWTMANWASNAATNLGLVVTAMFPICATAAPIGATCGGMLDASTFNALVVAATASAAALAPDPAGLPVPLPTPFMPGVMKLGLKF